MAGESRAAAEDGGISDGHTQRAGKMRRRGSEQVLGAIRALRGLTRYQTDTTRSAVVKNTICTGSLSLASTSSLSSLMPRTVADATAPQHCFTETYVTVSCGEGSPRWSEDSQTGWTTDHYMGSDGSPVPNFSGSQ